MGGGGSASGGLEVVPGDFRVVDTPLVPIADGDAVLLQLPPQGGRVLFIGAKIRGARANTVRIRVRLGAPDGTEIKEDTRTVVTGPPDADGWADTLTASYLQQANLEVCPNELSFPIDGGTFPLEVEVTEVYVDAPRTTLVERTVKPGCAAGDDVCKCLCDADFVLGKCPATKG